LPESDVTSATNRCKSNYYNNTIKYSLKMMLN
jgi:hypothetical protein